jgi:hypothetical protein
MEIVIIGLRCIRMHLCCHDNVARGELSYIFQLNRHGIPYVVMASPSDLCRRAELFRSKLIAEFQLLESIDGSVQAPVYHSNEITGNNIHS